MIKNLILIHAIVEILGGMALIFYPQILFLTEPLTATTASIIKLFGVLVLVFGIGSLLVRKEFDYGYVSKRWVLIFMGYHIIQAMQCYGMYSIGLLSNIGSVTLHLALGLFFIITFMKERELYGE